MDISMIQEFVILAETGKYNAAAQRLHISQSTLTRHIQTMEQELNCPLFIRTTREVALSVYGEIFLEHAKKIVNEYAAGESRIKGLAGEQNSMIQIGIVRNPDRYQIVDCLLEFEQIHPDISFRIVEGSLSELRSEFLNGHLNIITMTYADWEQRPACFIPAGRSRLAAVLPADHPFAAYPNIAVSLLKDSRIMLPEKTSIVYQYLQHVLGEHHITANIFYEGNSSGIAPLLHANMGILIQDYALADKQTDDTLVLRTLEPDIAYTYGLEYNDHLTRCEQTFVHFIRKRFERTGLFFI